MKKSIIWIYGPQMSGKTIILRYFEKVIFKHCVNLWFDDIDFKKHRKVNHTFGGVTILFDGFDEKIHNGFLSECNLNNHIVLTSYDLPSEDFLKNFSVIVVRASYKLDY